MLFRFRFSIIIEPFGSSFGRDVLASRRPLLHWLLLIALLARSAVAPGYMPADDGRLLALCPDGLPVAVAEVLLGNAGHDHSGHDESDGNAHSEWALERCALGAALAAAGLPTGEAVWSAPDVQTLPLGKDQDVYLETLSSAFRARAPPVLRQQD